MEWVANGLNWLRVGPNMKTQDQTQKKVGYMGNFILSIGLYWPALFY